MAVGTPVFIAEDTKSIGGGGVTTASFTIPDGDVAFACVFAENNNLGSGSFSDTFSTLTWTLRYTDAETRMRVYTATGDSTSASTSGTVGHTFNGAGGIHAFRVSGADETTSTNTAENTWGGGVDEDVVLPSSIATGSIAVAFHGGNNTTAVSSTNEITGGDTGDSNFCIGYATSGDTVEFTHAGHSHVQIGWEVEESTGGGVTPIPPKLHNLDDSFATIIASKLNGHLQ